MHFIVGLHVSRHTLRYTQTSTEVAASNSEVCTITSLALSADSEEYDEELSNDMMKSMQSETIPAHPPDFHPLPF